MPRAVQRGRRTTLWFHTQMASVALLEGCDKKRCLVPTKTCHNRELTSIKNDVLSSSKHNRRNIVLPLVTNHKPSGCRHKDPETPSHRGVISC